MYPRLLDGSDSNEASLDGLEGGAVAQRPRPDLATHDYVVRLPIEIAVKELAGHLGRKLTAYIAGVKDVRSVDEWAAGRRVPNDPLPQRLKFALEIAKLIAEHDDDQVAQSWFQGLNPQLEDRSPARLLREEPLDEVGPAIRQATLAFLVGA